MNPTQAAQAAREARILSTQAAFSEEDLKERHFTFNLPKAELDALVRPEGLLATTVLCLLACKPPLGTEREWAAHCDDFSRRFIQFYMTSAVFDADGNVVYYDEAENKGLTASVRYAPFYLKTHGATLAYVMRKAVSQHDTSTQIAEVQSFFTQSAAGKKVARDVAKALAEFFNGDSTLAVKLMAPVVESLLRSRAKALGADVVRLPQAGKAGGYKTLSPVLTALKPLMDPTWWFFYQSTVGDPLLLNLRNSVAHNLKDSYDEGDFGVLLIGALYLVVGFQRTDTHVLVIAQ